MRELNVTGRRNVLKKIGTAGIIGGTSVVSLSNIATANVGPEWTYTYEDDTTIDNITHEYKYCLGVSLEYYGSFTDNTGNWLHQFTMCSTMGGRRNDGDGDWKEEGIDTGVSEHEITVDANPSDAGLVAGDNEDHLGCTPTPTEPISDPDFSDAAETAVEAAVGTLHPVVAAGISARNIYEALARTKNSDDSADISNYNWIYGTNNRPFDCSNFYHFYISQSDGCFNPRFDISCKCTGGAGGQAKISDRLNIEQPVDEGYCGIQTNKRIEHLSEKYSVSEVPKSVIESDKVLSDFNKDGDVYRILLPIESESLNE